MLNFNKLKTESSKLITNLIDSSLKIIRALKQLDIKHNKFSELILINIILSKLYHETRKLFEMSADSNELHDWDLIFSIYARNIRTYYVSSLITRN